MFCLCEALIPSPALKIINRQISKTKQTPTPMSTSTIRLGVKPFPQKSKREQLPRYCVNRSQSDCQGLPGELRAQSRGAELSRDGCRLEVHLHSETTRALHSKNHQKEPERSSYRTSCHKTDQQQPQLTMGDMVSAKQSARRRGMREIQRACEDRT